MNQKLKVFHTACSGSKRVAWSVVLFLSAFIAAPQGASAATCPTTTFTNTDCAFIITIGTGNVLTIRAVPGASTYDGSDDVLVGVVNNSGSTFSSAIPLTATASGSPFDIFGFDQDGICTFITCTWAHPTGYEGPLTTFTNINAAGTTGNAKISGLLNGATTYFSLEGPPNLLLVPEPATWWMFGLGLAGLGMASKRRKIV